LPARTPSLLEISRHESLVEIANDVPTGLQPATHVVENAEPKLLAHQWPTRAGAPLVAIWNHAEWFGNRCLSLAPLEAPISNHPYGSAVPETVVGPHAAAWIDRDDLDTIVLSGLAECGIHVEIGALGSVTARCPRARVVSSRGVPRSSC
jgi:hypothetical protein